MPKNTHKIEKSQIIITLTKCIFWDTCHCLSSVASQPVMKYHTKYYLAQCIRSNMKFRMTEHVLTSCLECFMQENKRSLYHWFWWDIHVRQTTDLLKQGWIIFLGFRISWWVTVFLQINFLYLKQKLCKCNILMAASHCLYFI